MGMLLSSLWRRFFSHQQFKICLVGLDNAGKTTILFQLHMGEVVETQPTIGSNVEEVVHNNIHFNVWDLGGQESLRQGWHTYFMGTHAIIIVVDSTDKKRIPTVKAELYKLLEHVELTNAVVLVFANKQDWANTPAVQNNTNTNAASSQPSSSTASSATPVHSSSSSTTTSPDPSSSSSTSPPSVCMTPAEIASELNLQSIRGHQWHIQGCCALTGEGLYEGIEWVAQAVTQTAKS